MRRLEDDEYARPMAPEERWRIHAELDAMLDLCPCDHFALEHYAMIDLRYRGDVGNPDT